MNISNMVSQTDPRAGYLEYASDIDAAFARVTAGGRYILGEEVEAFEREFADYLGVRHVVGVASGTDAIVAALRAAGVKPGEGVATVSHTAVATVAAIELAGAVPILVDIDAEAMTIDAGDLAALLASPPMPIAAVIPVHLYGKPAAMGEVLEIAAQYGISVIEDVAQAHGARAGGKRLGSLGLAGAFSFYPTKNLGALGDGGAVATNDEALADRLRALRQYGWVERQISSTAGMNSRLDELQAAILRAKLPGLDHDNERRRSVAARYDAGLAGLGLRLPATDTGHVYHQYVMRSADRDGLRARMMEAGVQTALHYPKPVHMQPAYAGRLATGPSTLRNTEVAAGEILSLPMFPQMTDAMVERVIEVVRRIVC